MVIKICGVFLSAAFVRKTVVSHELVAISARHTRRRTVGVSVTVVQFYPKQEYVEESKSNFLIS